MTRSEFLRTVFGQGVALTLLSTESPAAGKWEFLGETQVNGLVDHDIIPVGIANGTFRRIQIYVQNATINFLRVNVHFYSGGDFPVQMASKIPAGGRTREIDLSGGNKRFLKSVEFWYTRGSWGNLKPPRLRLVGIRW
jgi:hypothetical protein